MNGRLATTTTDEIDREGHHFVQTARMPFMMGDIVQQERVKAQAIWD
jgi:hypothetical protein